MPYAISYNAEAGVIEAQVKGDLFLSEARDLISEAMEVAKEQNCYLILCDLQAANVKLSTLEIHQLPNVVSEKSASLGFHAHKLKRALVATRDVRDYDFFETVTVNRGQNARVFRNVDEARKWLLEK
jgi:hypothetical protein